FGQLQQRMAGADFAQRVEVGDEVAEVAVGVNEANDGGLGSPVGGGGTGGDRLRRTQLETLEEGAPAGVHRFGVLLPALIGRLDGIDIETTGNRTMTHNFKFPVNPRAEGEGPVSLHSIIYIKRPIRAKDKRRFARGRPPINAPGYTDGSAGRIGPSGTDGQNE